MTVKKHNKQVIFSTITSLCDTLAGEGRRWICFQAVPCNTFLICSSHHFLFAIILPFLLFFYCMGSRFSLSCYKEIKTARWVDKSFQPLSPKLLLARVPWVFLASAKPFSLRGEEPWTKKERSFPQTTRNTVVFCCLGPNQSPGRAEIGRQVFITWTKLSSLVLAGTRGYTAGPSVTYLACMHLSAMGGFWRWCAQLPFPRSSAAPRAGGMGSPGCSMGHPAQVHGLAPRQVAGREG